MISKFELHHQQAFCFLILMEIHSKLLANDFPHDVAHYLQSCFLKWFEVMLVSLVSYILAEWLYQRYRQFE